MSLNGLDAPAVQDAYQSAVADAGGWFLLRYTTRDAVELLGRGKGGVHEARAAIAKYEEASPLYGLIVYRRRKVLIKYIPDGTSRLLQARTAVHFQDVVERYSPYETLLEISTAEAMNDTSLAASFPLHTASPSASSSKLQEISEDGEDSGNSPGRTADRKPSTSSTFASQRLKRMDQSAANDRLRMRTPSIQVTSNDNSSMLSSDPSPPQKTSISQFLVRDDSGQRSITSLGSHPSFGSMTDYAPSDTSGKSSESTAIAEPESKMQTASTEPSAETAETAETAEPAPAEQPASSTTVESPPRNSSEHAEERASLQERPSMSESVEKKDDYSDLIDWSKFEPKPKIRLAPRPVIAGEKTKRPTVASISSLPASYRPHRKQEPNRPPIHALENAAPALLSPVLPAPPPIPDMPEYNPRPLSRGSIKSLPSHKSAVMTPDKIRLMKAVELRKRQLRKSNPQAATFVAPKEEDAPAIPKHPEESSATAPQPPNTVSEREQEHAPHPDEEQHAPSKKADSGIEMEYDESAKQSGRPSEDSQVSSTYSEEHVSNLGGASHDKIQPVNEPLTEPTVSLDMLGDGAEPLIDTSDTVTRSGVLDTMAAHHPTPSNIPTIVMADGSRPISSYSATAQPDQSSPDLNDQNRRSDVSDVSGAGVLEPSPQSPTRKNSDLARRRRGIVEPLHIDPDANLSSDDELFEELQSATFQEAKPISVARSPLNPSFPRKTSAISVFSDKSVNSVRSVNIRKSSSPIAPERSATLGPMEVGPREEDGTSNLRSNLMPNSGEEPGDSTHGLRRNLSAGITERINALHEKSSRELNASPVPLTSSELFTQGSWKDRKNSIRGLPRSRGSSFQRHSNRLSGYASSNGAKPMDGFQQSEPVWSIQRDHASNRNSVSVTARIVRPAQNEQGDESAQSDGLLQQSQLYINRNHQLPPIPIEKELPPIITNAPSSVSKSESNSSLASSPAATRGSVEYRTLHSAQSKGLSRHKQNFSQRHSTSSSANPDDFPAPPLSTSNLPSPVPTVEENAPFKEGSRTSRFFKRMSYLSGSKRKSAQQSLNDPGLTVGGDAVAKSASMSEKPEMPPPAIVGDLNVQFPDSLLWKRRVVEIDDAGYLVFSVPNAMHMQRGVVKKFRLDEFKLPYLPDLDRQELPHSVLLDFMDGTTLQAACVDATTQKQVLQVLRTHWRAWAEGTHT